MKTSPNPQTVGELSGRQREFVAIVFQSSRWHQSSHRATTWISGLQAASVSAAPLSFPSRTAPPHPHHVSSGNRDVCPETRKPGGNGGCRERPPPQRPSARSTLSWIRRCQLGLLRGASGLKRRNARIPRQAGGRVFSDPRCQWLKFLYGESRFVFSKLHRNHGDERSGGFNDC